MPAKPSTRPLVNIKPGKHSNILLVGMDFTDWKVEPDVKDNSRVKGEWTAKGSKKGDLTKELRILLKCTKTPQRDKDRDPADGTMTITLTKMAMTETVDVPSDYVNDDPP
jgi:hypothetical protein